MGILNKLRLLKQDNRSAMVLRNIIGASGLKVVNIAITLIIVPLTISYVSGVKYGIWLTLSSIIGWITYFDLGLSHGFRNRFTESIARDQHIKARELVSTTYISLGVIFLFLGLVASIINIFINWSELLNIEIYFNGELRNVFQVLILSFSINCVSNTVNVMLTAAQKSAYAALIMTCGQILGLIGIIYFKYFGVSSLFNLAIAYSLVPSVFYIIISIWIFTCTRYKRYSPTLNLFRKDLIKDIIGLGGKFFIIMLSTLIIFQCVNIIISRILGPMMVTEYNIAYKYFNTMHMFAVIVLMPFWSAFTEAYAKTDYLWMKKMIKKLELFGMLSIVCIIIMCFTAQPIFKLWIGNSIKISFNTIIIVASYISTMVVAQIYMYLINGIGKVSLQMYIYIICALVAIPTMLHLGRIWSLGGIIIVPVLAFVIQAIVGKIQLSKLTNQTAQGIWNK